METQDTANNKKQWDDLPTVARLMMRHYFPTRAPKEGLVEDLTAVLDEKRVRRIAKVGVAQFFNEEPAMIQRAAFELAAVSSTSGDFEVDAKQVTIHVEDGDLAAAQKHLSYMAMLISTEIEFPPKTDENLLKSDPVLIEA